MGAPTTCAGCGRPPLPPPGTAASGLFVVFEGGEGAGKTTQVHRLAQALEVDGHDTVLTREPGGPPLSEAIRGLILDPDGGGMTARTEALLFAAARAEHLDRVVRPALEAGKVVICDRFVDSSVVYQGMARGLGADHVADLNRWATRGLVPDVTVLLDVDATVGLERAGRDTTADRIEAEGAGFHTVVNESFRLRADTDPDRYLVVDAARDPDDIAAEVARDLAGRLAAKTG
jgi:dTMP kinase